MLIKIAKNSKKNQIEIPEMKISISQIKNRVDISPVSWIKFKTEYKGLKTRQIY
jgi:hypothetical protein